MRADSGFPQVLDGLCRAHTGRHPHRLTSPPGQMSNAVEDIADLHTESTRDAYERGHRGIRAPVFDVHQVLGAEPGSFRRFLRLSVRSTRIWSPRFLSTSTASGSDRASDRHFARAFFVNLGTSTDLRFGGRSRIIAGQPMLETGR
jgi:hypothetical protein